VPKALESYVEAYNLTERRVSMRNPLAIAETVATPRRDVDLMALVGGGGEWLSVCSDRHVCTAVSETEGVPIVSAVGHEGNHPLVEAVVHQAFATPSLFGIWLKERAEAARDETDRRLASLEREREQLQQALQAEETTRRVTEAQVQTLQRRQKTYHFVWGAVTVVVIVGILMMLMAR
jgi:exonuclease VII large subunit